MATCLLLFGVAGQQAGCSCSDSSQSGWDVVTTLDGGGSSDIGRDGYSVTDVDAVDSHTPSDARADAGEGGSVPSAWERPNPCDGMVDYPPDNRDFSKPERAGQLVPLTRERMLQKYNGAFPRQGISFQPAGWLEPSTDYFDSTLFARRDEAVTIRFAYVQDSATVPDETVWLTASLLVNYKPVELELTRWNMDRSAPLNVERGTGFQFQVEGDAELFDLSIPAGVLDEGQMYELSSIIDVGTNAGKHHVSSLDRHALLYGGYNRASHPCFEPPLDEEWTDRELAISRDGGAPSAVAPVVLFPASMQDNAALDQGVFPAQPGQRITMNISLPNLGNPQRPPKPAVLVPLLDGQPLDERWYVFHSSKAGGDRPLVSARKQFEVQVPEEPGLYRVMVGSWKDAHRLPTDLDGNRHEDVFHTLTFAGSNVVVFRVDE